MEPRIAPAGQFRVIGVNSINGSDVFREDFNSQSAATVRSEEAITADSNVIVHIYNDQGVHVNVMRCNCG